MKTKEHNIDYRIFIPSLVIAVVAITLMICFSDFSGKLLDRCFYFLTYKIGWVYLLLVAVLLVFSLWIAFSKFGSIKLGDKDTPKQYSDFSWTAMIFAAGMSIAVVLLGFIEPINLLMSTPQEIEPMSDKAYEYAHMYAQFFQGPAAWCVYGPASAAVGYTIYVKKENVLKLSSACTPVLGDYANRWPGVTIDVLVMLGMIGGISTSLGMGAPTVTALIEYITGIPQSTFMTVVVMFIWACIFGTSVFLGLDKGIKKLSDINLYVMFFLMALVFFVIPKRAFFFNELNSLGLMIDNIGELMLGSSIFGTSTFTEDWTVFYWAWWLAFMPMVALFGARVSKGRTIRQMILGELVYGGGGSLLVFGLFGAYSLHLQRSGAVDLVKILAEQGREQTLIAIVNTLPMHNITMVLVLCLIFIFLATTIDSTAYTLASVCTKKLSGDEQPARYNRITWAVILLLFALGLVLLGGLQIVQTASILLGFPLIFVTILIMVSVKKMFNAHKF